MSVPHEAPPRQTRTAAFEQAGQRARAEATRVGKRADRLGYVRLLAFVGLVALGVLAFSELGVAAALAAVALGLAGFNYLVGLQQAADAERDRQTRIAELNDGELASVDYDFSGFDGGARYADYDHPYTGDLDVFGDDSVFALLNRTSSLVGERALADYVRYGLRDVGEIEQRQAALRELAPQLGFRQDFLAAAPAGEQSAAQLNRLRAWARAEPQFREGYWRWLLIAVPLVNVAWLASFFYLPFYLALLGYAPTAYLLYRQKAKVDTVEAATSEALDQLRQLSAMIGVIGGRTWEAPLLRALAGRLGGLRQNATRAAEPPSADSPNADRPAGARGAGDRIADLARDVRQLGIRANPYVIPFNILSLWELRYARRIEAWKVTQAAVAEDIGGFPAAAAFGLPGETGGGAGGRASDPAGATFLDAWLRAVGAFDALVSMAGAAYRYPHWRFPSVVQGVVATAGPSDASGVLAQAARVTGEGLHHPLLPPGKSVPNDFASPLHRHISLLTGSNMAGKSTLLRTIGLHLAMAQWGMPTPHTRLELSPVAVYTSMRTQDNLHEGASAFYAELKRLRVVVDATREGEAVFFLLDEILKGTNSQDRNAGGRALILQLLEYGGAGVVATHDLALGRLADETDAVTTLRLEVETSDAGELFFDYTVKPGLAQSRNATALMRRLGLGV